MVKSLLHRSEHLINEDRERPTGTRSWWWESLRPGWCLRPFSNRDRGYNLPCIRPSVMMWPKDQRTIEPSPWQLSILYPDVLQLKVLGGKKPENEPWAERLFCQKSKMIPWRGYTVCIMATRQLLRIKTKLHAVVSEYLQSATRGKFCFKTKYRLESWARNLSMRENNHWIIEIINQSLLNLVGQ